MALYQLFSSGTAIWSVGFWGKMKAREAREKQQPTTKTYDLTQAMSDWGQSFHHCPISASIITIDYYHDLQIIKIVTSRD